MEDGRTLVIIVDDDQAVRDALQFALRLEGLCIHVHDSAASLLADPDLSQAGCVILDHRMPRMDGFALLSSVQVHNPGVPAIMLTSRVTTRERARAQAAGVRAVLEKPLLENVLMDNIRAILSSGSGLGSGSAGAHP